MGTSIAEGKDVREFDGHRYVMERGLVADLSIVHAYMGDTEGNLVYRKTARNFNPMMATAGKVTVAEVEALVAVGQLDPDQIHTPGIFVDRILKGPVFEKRIERVTIAEVEELVDVGQLDADQIHTPGIYVQRIFRGTQYEKPIEQRTVRRRSS